jgi:thiol-disulfide isomerase/thioredoxin
MARPATHAGPMAAALALALLTTARGQDAATGRKPDAAPEFPAAPGQWLNGPPLTTTALEGKAAFLWFFEETCPKCRGKWPSLLATARKYQGKPIVFVAVNSGNPPEEVAQYAREVGLDWPILVDPTRDFEKKSGVGEISLENIYQVRLLTADGRMVPGDWSDIEGSISRALAGASWRVDPATVPASLRRAWHAVETGDFAAAAPAIKRALKSRTASLKKAAQSLDEAVRKELDAQLAEARTARGRGDAWAAYKALAAIPRRFRGYEVPKEVEEVRSELASDPAVKAELAGQKELGAIRKLLAAPTDASRRRGLSQLRVLARQAPETDAAREARALLERLRAGDTGAPG